MLGDIAKDLDNLKKGIYGKMQPMIQSKVAQGAPGSGKSLMLAKKSAFPPEKGTSTNPGKEGEKFGVLADVKSGEKPVKTPIGTTPQQAALAKSCAPKSARAR